MTYLKGPFVCCVLLTMLCSVPVESSTLRTLRARRSGSPKMEPTEAIIFPGDNVTYVCSHKSNTTFRWDFSSEINSFEIQQGSALSDESPEPIFYSRLTIYSSSRRMSGEIVCSVDEGESKAFGLLIVNGVPNGGACRTSSDCRTNKATCQNMTCECPRNFVRLRIKGRNYEVCREMIYSLYDPCESDEQCMHLVDSKSVCKAVCVCAPWARDRKGKCVAMSEITYNRSQEMYRVGLIAVTCIIILIVAVSLWVTLKRSCREQNTDGQRRSFTQNDSNDRYSIDLTMDKPPSYDDVLVTQGSVSPPTIKDALKNSMTAKRLLRQVSAPAGQLLPQPIVQQPKAAEKC